MVPPHEVGAGLAPALSSSPVAQDGCVQRPRPRLVATASSCISSSGYASSVSFSPVCPSTTPAIKVSQVWAGYDRRPLRPAAGATGRPSTCVGATRRLSIRFIHPIRCPKTHTGLATPNHQAGERLASSHIMRQARAPVSSAFGSGRRSVPALRRPLSVKSTVHRHDHRLRQLPRPHLPDDPVRPAVRADYVTRRLLERVSFLQRRGRPVLVLTPPLAANHPLVFCHARLLLVVELLALVRAIVRRLEPRILHVAVTRLPAALPPSCMPASYPCNPCHPWLKQLRLLPHRPAQQHQLLPGLRVESHMAPGLRKAQALHRVHDHLNLVVDRIPFRPVPDRQPQIVRPVRLPVLQGHLPIHQPIRAVPDQTLHRPCVQRLTLHCRQPRSLPPAPDCAPETPPTLPPHPCPSKSAAHPEP